MILKHRFGRLLLSLVCLAVLTACKGPLTFSIRFDRAEGLKQEDPVVFSYQEVGRVKEITYTREADFLVTVEIQEAFLYLATEHSRFRIGNSPFSSGQKAVLLEQIQDGGRPLEPGALVRGQPGTNPLNQTADSLEKVLETAFTAVLRELQDFQKSQEYKDLKQELSRLGTRLKTAGREMEEALRRDILPHLEKKLREIIKELEEQGHQDKAQELQQEFQKLQDI